MSEELISALRREGAESDEDSEHRLEGCLGQENLELRFEIHAQIWKTISDRGNSQYKGPKVRRYLAC